MEALSSTHYVKSIITAETPMDLERKKEQSFQGDMYVRFMAFSNGDLEALYDKSEGFFRRQLILQTKRKPPGRVDDPYLSDKLKQEAEGIFLWCLEGLKRLQANSYRFTVSRKAAENKEHAKRNASVIPYSMEYLKRKIVIYARVSTEHEAQISALENQLDWYKPLLDLHPEWTLVERYIDEAFVSRIVVSKEGFDWYLRFDGDPDKPLHCQLQGKRKTNTKIMVSGDISPAIENSPTGGYQK